MPTLVSSSWSVWQWLQLVFGIPFAFIAGTFFAVLVVAAAIALAAYVVRAVVDDDPQARKNIAGVLVLGTTCAILAWAFVGFFSTSEGFSESEFISAQDASCVDEGCP